ncbi:MAG: radical SAM protein, partial [Candidatus Omnitrophica bacterium]|nr:radical SAM protein [Candidatus Omnitrophota bacterium]
IRDRKSLEEVNGIAFLRNGKFVRTPPRELIKNLDDIPFPARDAVPLDVYFPPPTKRVSSKNATSMIASRGCPFKCTYCIAVKMWEHKCRFRSPKNVVDEMELCVTKYNLGEFNFHDELFTMSKNHVLGICDEIKRRRLDVAWVCMARADYVTEEILKAMREAGCKKIMYGFESGSQEILDNIKKETTVDEARRAVELTKRSGIRVAGNFMIGNIGETKETIRKSIDLAKELDPDTVAFFVAIPYPGTEFYDQARQNGYLRKDFEWKDFTLVSNNKPPLNLPGVSADEIEQWKKRAYREFYMRPSYVWKKLSEIQSPRDLKNIYEGAKLLLRIS